jgi:hypothetical protein
MTSKNNSRKYHSHKKYNSKYVIPTEVTTLEKYILDKSDRKTKYRNTGGKKQRKTRKRQ